MIPAIASMPLRKGCVCCGMTADGKDLYGEEEWKRMSKREHVWCDYFCANDSRNLHFDAFGRLYEAYIKRQLGPALEAARVKSGGRVWVEASGELTHIGPK